MHGFNGLVIFFIVLPAGIALMVGAGVLHEKMFPKEGSGFGEEPSFLSLIVLIAMILGCLFVTFKVAIAVNAIR
jgi:hypothetical protein